MKKILALVLALVMALTLMAGCSNDAQSTGGNEDAIVKKVALVTDVGTIDDESFNQACWQAVEAWCTENKIEYTYYKPNADSTEERVLSVAQAVAEGANVIVMPGFLFGATLIHVQEQYPDVYFIAVDVAEGDLTEDYTTYYDLNSNVVCTTFSEEQAGYLAGYAAVKDGYTKLGFLGGMAVPAVIRYGYGFVQGCNDAAAELGITVEVNYNYGGQFFGDDNITAKMDGWYSEGTEVVFACGGGIWTSAAAAAMNYDGKVIGVDVDQNYCGADTNIYPYNPFITSSVKGLQNVTETILEELNNGNWDKYSGKFVNYSLAEGDYVGLATAEGSWKLENFSVEDLEVIKAGIKDGTIAVDSTFTEADVSKYEYTNVTVKFVA